MKETYIVEVLTEEDEWIEKHITWTWSKFTDEGKHKLSKFFRGGTLEEAKSDKKHLDLYYKNVRIIVDKREVLDDEES